MRAPPIRNPPNRRPEVRALQHIRSGSGSARCDSKPHRVREGLGLPASNASRRSASSLVAESPNQQHRPPEGLDDCRQHSKASLNRSTRKSSYSLSSTTLCSCSTSQSSNCQQGKYFLLESRPASSGFNECLDEGSNGRVVSSQISKMGYSSTVSSTDVVQVQSRRPAPTPPSGARW